MTTVEEVIQNYIPGRLVSDKEASHARLGAISK